MIAVDAIVPIDVLWPLVRGFDELKAPTQLRFWHEVLSGSWEALLSGRADLVVGAPGDAPADHAIRLQPLGRIEFVYCVSPQHPLARITGTLTPEQIASHRAIAVADSARAMPSYLATPRLAAVAEPPRGAPSGDSRTSSLRSMEKPVAARPRP